MNVETITLGCRLNYAESETMKRALEGQGTDEKLVIVNSCAVTVEAVRHTRQAIKQPQFAKRISDINSNPCPRFLPSAAQRHRQIPGQSGNIRPSLRMARHNHRQQTGVIQGE